MTRHADEVEFDDVTTMALAQAADVGHEPPPGLRTRILAALAPPPVPEGFAFRFAAGGEWLPHPVPGIRMQVLSENREAGYAMLLVDAAPGTTFPPHRHTGAEECYVLSGTVETCDRRMTAGDFLHADAGTDHGGLYTPDGAQVILVVALSDYR
jgi:quercetin dioxygenase-like cupin family protein